MKLNLGCGTRILPDYANLDAQELTGVDIVCDVKKVPFENGSIQKIFCSHLIEHFWWEDVGKILKDWFNLLEEGGEMELWTVDFERVIRNYKDNPDMEYVNWRMYNQQRHTADEHQGCFDFRYLKLLLLKAGFSNVERLPLESFPFQAHEDINMGVRAIK